jgi:PBP1b-binding outer membrane lipoprotein LpoB
MDVPRIIFIAVLLAGCTGGDRQAARTTTDTTVTPVMTTDTTVVQQKVNVQVDTVKKTHHKP